MEQRKEIKQNWKGAENFGVCFCVIFNCYYKSFFFLWTLGITQFWDFSNTSWFSKILSTSSATQRQLLYNAFIVFIKYHFTFLKCSKFSKHYFHGYLRIFLLLYTPEIIAHVSNKTPSLTQKINFYWQNTTSQS